MKKIAITSLSALILAGCGGAGTAVQQNANAARTGAPNAATETVSSHSTGAPPAPGATIVPKSETKTKWTQSGNPIDTTAFDAEIAQTEKTLKTKPSDAAAKKAAADAFFKRATALTEARQYASAIGDYRRAYKLDSTNPETKVWIEKIISIYDSINRSYPNEGEEPPPLPFKKDGKI